VVLLLPLSPLGSFSLRAKVVAEPLLDACKLSEIHPLSCLPEEQHTHDTVWTQVMCALDSSTARALVERCDILETLASHLSVTLLHV
jgi:hypothetical protein